MLSCPKFLVAAANPNMEECASAAVQAVMYVQRNDRWRGTNSFYLIGRRVPG
jgi:hypothetical protein